MQSNKSSEYQEIIFEIIWTFWESAKCVCWVCAALLIFCNVSLTGGMFVKQWRLRKVTTIPILLHSSSFYSEAEEMQTEEVISPEFQKFEHLKQKKELMEHGILLWVFLTFLQENELDFAKFLGRIFILQ